LSDIPIRLMQVIAGGKNGGAEEFFVRLAIGLERAGINQRVVVRSDRSWSERMIAAGVDTKLIKFGGYFDHFTRRQLNQQIEDFKPTHLLTWMNRATRVVSRLHSNLNYTHIARLGGYYDTKYYKNCDHLIGNTPKIVSYLRDLGCPADRVHYLPNFADSSSADPIPRSTFGTPDNVSVILALGRCHENKGFDVLLDALPSIPSVWLWIAGDGPCKKKLEKQAECLDVSNRVCFLGWRRDVPALLASADVFVCSSRHEPLGNIILEAWASSTPVISTNADGPCHLIEPGKEGLLVPIEDPEALSNSINTLLENHALSERLAKDGFEKFNSEFTENVVVKKYISLLQQTI